MVRSKQFSNRDANVSKSEMTYILYLAGIQQDQNVELNLYNYFCQFGTINETMMMTHQWLSGFGTDESTMIFIAAYVSLTRTNGINS